MFTREVYEPREDARAELERAIAQLRSEVKTEVRALRSVALKSKVTDDLVAEIASLRAMLDEIVGTPKRGDAISSLLRTRGIEGRAAATLARLAKAKTEGSTGERAAAAITETIAIAPWPIATNEKSLVALVGPAGVGKTTTAAKLGARARMQKKTVAFVSCDGFRVGAIGQLASYAELMDARFYEVATPEELAEVVANETSDVLVLDTSGRVPEPGSVEAAIGDAEFRAKLDEHRKVEVLLCVPAALRAADAASIQKGFAASCATSICVTKLDETDAPSALVHAPYVAKLPLSTVCFGQRVPEDIATATTEDLVARLTVQR